MEHMCQKVAHIPNPGECEEDYKNYKGWTSLLSISYINNFIYSSVLTLHGQAGIMAKLAQSTGLGRKCTWLENADGH